ncbi:MAG: hypothetical protein M3041_14875 [Acidobacteriota bacterium]|nr:hypothetical protein [Acidobacteriota bacterium]
MLAIAAAARLLLQMAALPPYAGLDEIYHVSRLAFVLQEGRNPAIDENSIPRYLASTMAGDPTRMPDFGGAGPGWPEVVKTRRVLVDHAVDRDYVRSNIESQQPRLYYSIAGRAARVLTDRTQMSELRFWRFASVIFAIGIVMATARMGQVFFGARGIVAAALLVSLPTWLTLVVRASNDAFACALLATALALTASAPARTLAIAAEAVAWALALAAKLYTWPIFVAALIFWRRQRASVPRVAAVIAASAISVALTIADLISRTHNPLGILAFDRAAGAATPQPIRILEMIKISIASGIWASGQHWNALTPAGMILFALPILVLIVPGVARSPHRNVVFATVLTFAAAQLVHAAGYIRRARASGLALPAAGKEGWFWYALAPLVVATIFPMTPLPLLGTWLIGWDVVIHEGALFHDFAGATSPATPSWLFRWGPLHAPFTADLSHVAVGPFVSLMIALRVIHVVAVFALSYDALRRRN